MGKKKLTPAEAGKGTKSLANYFSVLGKPDENKKEEKRLKNDDITGFSEIINIKICITRKERMI